MKAFQQYKKEFRFLHPLSDNVSKNGYVFHLFQYLDLNDRDIYAISREYTGVADKTSRLEMEYVQYLSHKFPASELIHAWSAYGQRKFKSCVPDCIDLTKGIFYFFMGCYYHSHDRSVCSMKKKNWTDKISKEKQDQFEKKIEKLKQECDDVKEVVL